MILTLMASIMYWCLQQEDLESSPSHSESATVTDISSAAPSVQSEDESSICGEISSLNIDDAASDSTVSSVIDNIEDDDQWR